MLPPHVRFNRTWAISNSLCCSRRLHLEIQPLELILGIFFTQQICQGILCPCHFSSCVDKLIIYKSIHFDFLVLHSIFVILHSSNIYSTRYKEMDGMTFRFPLGITWVRVLYITLYSWPILFFSRSILRIPAWWNTFFLRRIPSRVTHRVPHKTSNISRITVYRPNFTVSASSFRRTKATTNHTTKMNQKKEKKSEEEEEITRWNDVLSRGLN